MICFHEIFAKDHKSKQERDLNNLAFSRIFWRMEKKGKFKYKWVFNIVNTFTNLRMRKLRSLCVFTKFLQYEKNKKNKFKFLLILTKLLQYWKLHKKRSDFKMFLIWNLSDGIFTKKRIITLHFFNFLGSIGRRIAVPLQSEKRCIKIQPYEMLFWGQKGQSRENSRSWNYPCHSI